MMLSKIRAKCGTTRKVGGATIKRQGEMPSYMKAAKKAKAAFAHGGRVDGESAKPRLDRPGRKIGTSAKSQSMSPGADENKGKREMQSKGDMARVERGMPKVDGEMRKKGGKVEKEKDEDGDDAPMARGGSRGPPKKKMPPLATPGPALPPPAPPPMAMEGPPPSMGPPPMGGMHASGGDVHHHTHFHFDSGGMAAGGLGGPGGSDEVTAGSDPLTDAIRSHIDQTPNNGAVSLGDQLPPTIGATHTDGSVPNDGMDTDDMRPQVHVNHGPFPAGPTGPGRASGGFMSGIHKGALHKEMGIPEGQKIPAKKLQAATHSENPTERRRAKLAETMKKWHHGG